MGVVLHQSSNSSSSKFNPRGGTGIIPPLAFYGNLPLMMLKVLASEDDEVMESWVVGLFEQSLKLSCGMDDEGVDSLDVLGW